MLLKEDIAYVCFDLSLFSSLLPIYLDRDWHLIVGMCARVRSCMRVRMCVDLAQTVERLPGVLWSQD